MSNIKTITAEEFQTEVLDATDKVMVEFGASWCGPCKALEPILDKVASEVSFKVVKLDTDDCPELTKKYSVRGVPTVMVFKDGKIVGTVVGLTNKEGLLKLANQ